MRKELALKAFPANQKQLVPICFSFSSPELRAKISIQINLKKAGVGQPKYCIYASARRLTNLCSTFHYHNTVVNKLVW